MASTLVCKSFSSLSGLISEALWYLLLEAPFRNSDYFDLQAFLEVHWNEHGKPTLDVLTQKVSILFCIAM